MKLRMILFFVFGFGFILTSAAEDASTQQNKIRNILLDAKFTEMDVQVDSKQANQVRDAESVQYKIGFKDGYQKAVDDLKKSLNSGAVPVGASQMAVAENPEKQKAKASKLVSTSFQNLVQDKDWDAAIKSATAAISLNPEDPVAYINRSWAYAEKNKLDEAISDANKAVALAPRNPMAYNNRAYAYELAGSLTKAKQDYKIACELKYQPACDTVAVFERALTGDTQKEVKELLNRSYQKFKKKDWKGVEEMSTKAIDIDPGNAMAYVNRAGARAELGLLSNALDDCNRAIQLNPGLGIAHNNCGYAYELLGQNKQAEVAYQQACNLGYKQSCRDYFRLFNSVH